MKNSKRTRKIKVDMSKFFIMTAKTSAVLHDLLTLVLSSLQCDQ